MNKLFLLPIFVLVFASGCNREADLGPLRDSPYYTDHPDERAAMIAKCEANPGEFDAHPNCINARDSLWKKTMGADGGDAKIPDLPDDPDELDAWRKN